MKHTQISSLLVLSSLVLSSCAHRAERVAKTDYGWRVQKQGGVTTGMPNYALSTDAYAAATAGAPKRAPASDADMALELEEADRRPSLRRLYFRALYQQYRELQQSAQSVKPLNSCPSFHHDRLHVDESAQAANHFAMNQARPELKELALYPEWMLPSKNTAKAAPIWKRKGDSAQLVSKALTVHAGKVRRELRTLCEHGSSDAYFRLENMVTYFAGRPEKQQKLGLESFLKIPAFSTMLLLRSTQSASNRDHFNAFDRALMHEVRGENFERYVNELRKRRFQTTTGAL